MFACLTFLGIAAFWLAMNALLWRVEFGERASETPVPLALIWHKIFTAPDASSLSIFQNGERMGYCEFSRASSNKRAIKFTSPATWPWAASPIASSLIAGFNFSTPGNGANCL